MEKKPFAELDLETVFRVAENELRIIAAEQYAGPMKDAVFALSKAYLWSYAGVGPLVREAYEWALQQIDISDSHGWYPAPGATSEFVCGSALAVAAWHHAANDIHLCHDHFVDKARGCLRAYDLVPLREEWDAPLNERAVGVDMSRRVQSMQGITAGQVKEFVLENLEYDRHVTDAERRAAELVLQPRDFESLAQGLMDSYRDIEYDRGDVDWLVDQAMEIARARPGFEEEVRSCQEAIDREEGLEEPEDGKPDLENEREPH